MLPVFLLLWYREGGWLIVPGLPPLLSVCLIDLGMVGIPIADSAERGAVDPYQRVFGQPGLHVRDGSVMRANPGVNSSLLITALAERACHSGPTREMLTPVPRSVPGRSPFRP
jgi:hypothetical protein